MNGYVHLEMRRAVWGLLQAGILANKRLCGKLEPFGYFKHANTPGLWYHKMQPISFTLAVDNFGVKYVKKEDVDHLIASIKKAYALTKDWTGNLYCGIALDWDCVNCTVDISMPGYIKKKMHEYNHIVSRTGQTCPYSPTPNQYGTEAQALLPPDLLLKLDKAGVKRTQQILGSMVLMALSTIAAEQTVATLKTMEKCVQLLDYLLHNLEVKVWFCALDMVLNISSNASYLSKANTRIRLCGHFFMGWSPKDGEAIRLSGAFHVSVNIMQFEVTSARKQN